MAQMRRVFIDAPRAILPICNEVHLTMFVTGKSMSGGVGSVWVRGTT